NYYEDVTNHQAPQASDGIPVSSAVQEEPPEKETDNEYNQPIFPTNVKIYRTINTFKILALLLYIALWIYQIIYNAINFSLNSSSVSANNGTNGTLPYPINYNPSASYENKIYAIADGLIWVIAFCCFVEFIINEIEFIKTTDDFNHDDDSQA
ncbi:8608_t:CDS:2, partial [Racocetra fulgida]